MSFPLPGGFGTYTLKKRAPPGAQLIKAAFSPKFGENTAFHHFLIKKTQNILKSLLFILHVYNPLNVPSENIADLIHTLIDICIHSVPQKSPGIIIHGCG